jgi:hypothetical protein
MAKEIFEIDYIIKTSPRILYDFVKLPTHLSQWFCERCDNKGDEYTFMWKGYKENATLIDDIEEELVAFQWENSENDEFFEFAIQQNEISGDTVLIITDFADANELEDQKLWWENQVVKLQRAMGS